jgi:RNA polymerase sigma factor (TIGR02999 family)
MSDPQDSSDPSDPSVTALLQAWRNGDPDALGRIMPQVYGELRRLAARQMQGEHADHTLQATALVHEAYARLVDADVPWTDRGHFFSVAAQAMRRILVDHARAREAQRRGGNPLRLTLNEDVLGDAGKVETSPEEFLLLEEALQGLEAFDARKARVVELRYFAGLNAKEIGASLGVGVATVQRDLRVARAWLRSEIGKSTRPKA